MSFERELEVARLAALEAAEVVRGHQKAGIDVERKAGDEPVTAADHAASELILRRLKAAFPGDSALSEEVPDDGARRHQARVWVIDPIDGTRDFIRGDEGFSVMIGLCVDGRPTVGVVAMPATRVTYGGIVGVGGWKDLADGSRLPLRTSSIAGPPGIRLVSSKSHRSDDIDKFRNALQIEDELHIGSVGVKASLVAEGSRDLYVYPGTRTKIWDACAPEAILIAAGGRFTDVRGRMLSYTGELLYNEGGIVASNGPLHDHVLALLEKLGRERLPPAG